MENFTNQTINTTQIPKFESVEFTNLEPDYWKVKLIYFTLTFCVLAIGFVVAVLNIDEFYDYKYQIVISFLVLFLIIFGLQRIGFKKKAFAFRNHDVLLDTALLQQTQL